ncbi:MAG: hypothetical protein IKD08_03550 [Alphaproteobacteria bacterium]|nr:hypothetical protein [Alphaproteobacteria bacterium]
MQTKTFIIAFLITLMGFSPALLADDFSESSFVPGFEDIPLMEGMSLAEDGTMSFDSPEGRFIQVYMSASPKASKVDITKFYEESLPPLGWQQKNGKQKSCYLREDEQLCIDISGTKPPFAVRFELKTVQK